MALKFKNRLSQSAKFIVLSPNKIALAIKLGLEMLHSDIEHVLISLDLD